MGDSPDWVTDACTLCSCIKSGEDLCNLWSTKMTHGVGHTPSLGAERGRYFIVCLCVLRCSDVSVRIVFVL